LPLDPERLCKCLEKPGVVRLFSQRVIRNCGKCGHRLKDPDLFGPSGRRMFCMSPSPGRAKFLLRSLPDAKLNVRVVHRAAAWEAGAPGACRDDRWRGGRIAGSEGTGTLGMEFRAESARQENKILYDNTEAIHRVPIPFWSKRPLGLRRMSPRLQQNRVGHTAPGSRCRSYAESRVGDSQHFIWVCESHNSSRDLRT